MTRPTLHVACAADEHYTAYCVTMLHALLTSQTGQPLVIHFLCDQDYPDGLLQKLEKFVTGHQGSFAPLQVDAQRIAGLPAMRRIPAIMWLRVMLPELLPTLDRILYVDVDTLAVDSLEELWNMEFDGALVAAVDNVLEPRMANHPAKLGIPADNAYFNSGVLLMNLAQMRTEGSSAKILEYAGAAGRQLTWPDQDALNVILGSRRQRLNPRWNCQNSFFFWREWSNAQLGEAPIDTAIRNPAILHFEGPTLGKPWHYLNRHPYRKTWLAHQRASSWPAPPLVGRSLGNMAKRHLSPELTATLRRALGRGTKPPTPLERKQ